MAVVLDRSPALLQDFGKQHLRDASQIASEPSSDGKAPLSPDALQYFMEGREAQAAAKQHAFASGNIFPEVSYITPPAELEKAAKFAAAKAAAATEAAARRSAEAKKQAAVRKHRAALRN